MGEASTALPRSARVPACRPAERDGDGRPAPLHADDRGDRDARHRRRTRRPGAPRRRSGTRSRRSDRGGRSCLRTDRAAGGGARRRRRRVSSPGMPGPACCPISGTGRTSLVISLLVLPVTFAVPWLALPAAASRWIPHIAAALVAPLVPALPRGLRRALQRHEASRADGDRLLVHDRLRSPLVGRADRRSIIPWVDVVSVWRGPTDYIVSEQPSLFDRVSIAFRLPGEEGSANIGPPDILFFALFLAAADRFALRVRWTWISMVGLLSLTLISTDVFDLAGLPALPAIALGFLAPERRPALEGLARARPRECRRRTAEPASGAAACPASPQAQRRPGTGCRRRARAG